MVDDPSSYPDLFPTEKKQEKERERLFRIIEDLVKWENTTNETVLQAARNEIWASWRRACAENADHPRAKELFDRHKLPAFHDPFAGGGALPLEAQRLGLEAYASDLNPVAVLINKAMIEIPPKFAGRPPVNPEAQASFLGARASRPHPDKGWHSRGYLPHFDRASLIQSLTFRLHDSLPADTIERWKLELGWRKDMSADSAAMVEMRKRIAEYEDAGHGQCWLGRDDVAQAVEEALLHFDGERYRLLAWCIMPNHVHVLAEIREGFTVSEIVQSWKSFTSKQANKILGRSGIFWMPDYFDRFIRNGNHLNRAIDYIENNPVKAGLAADSAEWKYSSSRRRKEAGGTPALPGWWRGTQGLAEDVRYYGKWMRDETEKRIGHLYPKIEITTEMVKERPDLKKYEGQKLTVIAWLWARTVKSPNPAFANVDVPLASTFMLSTKPGKEAYVEPVIEGDGYRFTVKVGKPKNVEAAKNGTKLSRGANFQCLISDTPIASNHIYEEANAGRMGARLMAVVAEGDRRRIYLAPTQEHETVARKGKPEWKPDLAMPENPRWFSPPLYGLKTYGDLFTPRQLVALTTFSDLVGEARERIRRDALAAGLPDDINPLRDGGTGATAYAEAVGVYLAFTVDRCCDFSNSCTRWVPGNQKVMNLFGKQAIAMTWDFPEAAILHETVGGFVPASLFIAECINTLPQCGHGSATQQDAMTNSLTTGKVVSTDPPYYDNIGYADLSDFFYLWLRRSLKEVFPNLFATLAVPKAEELVATPYRHGSKEKAETFFLEGMTGAMQRLAEQAHQGFPITIYYAFKQSESQTDSGTASTGWETFLDAVIRAGFAVSGTWPMRSEQEYRMIGMGTNALASSIVLVCRKREVSAPTATRREFVTALKAELPLALSHLQRGNIAPVDLAQAAIGPGMGVFTRYAKVLDAEGKPLSVRDALALINQTLDEALAEQEGDFDAHSRWALAWFEQSGFAEGEFGVADVLARAKNTSVAGMVNAGILSSSRGKVRLFKPAELSDDWDPTTDARLTAWESVHHLIRLLEAGGESAAASLVTKLGSKAEIARELCYRLYTLCERKKRAAEALSYNALVQSWPEIVRLAQSPEELGDRQREMF
ncbi:MAG: transposase [Blastocatellales bacterium]|nr:transposase [Blastocatellales bacterium]